MKIEAKILSYTYPLETMASIEDINISAESGQIVSLIGNNGHGKTTLCNILRRFIPDFYKGTLVGDVYLNGQSIQKFTNEDLSKIIGYVSQNPFVQITGSTETVYEEIAFGLENIGYAIEETKSIVDQIIKDFKFESIKDQNPLKLSGGQKQKVALAAVVAMNPDIYIIDEPTSQLDPISSKEILEIINNLKEQNKTIILVEHKMNYIAEYSDFVYFIENGSISISGKPKDVFLDLLKNNHQGFCPPVLLFANRCKEEGLVNCELNDLPIKESELFNFFKKGGTL